MEHMEEQPRGVEMEDYFFGAHLRVVSNTLAEQSI